MLQMVSTDPIPAHQRFDFWRDAVLESTMPIDVHTRHAEDFAASFTTVSLGGLEILDMQQKSIEVHRNRRLIRQGDPEVVHFVVSFQGNRRIVQDRNEVVLNPGDMTMYSSSRLLRTYADPSIQMESAVVAIIPRAMLSLPPAAVDELLTVRFARENPMAALVSVHMQALARDAHRYRPEDSPGLSLITVDLISMLLAGHLATERQLTPEAHDRVLLHRTKDFIDRHLRDPALTPELVAAAQHVSLRTLQRVFQSSGITVAGWIRDRRLERCHRDLADAQLRSLPVHAIAARWGFSHPTHFSRAFKLAYGITPQAHRVHAWILGARG